jgi:hypothetical protein
MHCGLHDAVQLIDGIVSPTVTVYVVVGGDSVTDSGPSKRNRNSAILFKKLQCKVEIVIRFPLSAY